MTSATAPIEDLALSVVALPSPLSVSDQQRFRESGVFDRLCGALAARGGVDAVVLEALCLLCCDHESCSLFSRSAEDLADLVVDPFTPRPLWAPLLRLVAVCGMDEGVQRVLTRRSVPARLVRLLEDRDEAVREAAADALAAASCHPRPGLIAMDDGAGVGLSLEQGAFEEGGLGHKVWDSARVLLAFLALLPPARAGLAGRSVVELGCGTGCVGVYLAKACGASRVVMTDGEKVLCDLALRNAARNGVSSLCSSLPLDWGCKEPPPELHGCDVVVAADVMYEAETMEGLVNLMASLAPWALVAGPGPNNRDGYRRFFEAVEKGGGKAHQLCSIETHPSLFEARSIKDTTVAVWRIEFLCETNIIFILSN
jgi:hypothetical protein